MKRSASRSRALQPAPSASTSATAVPTASCVPRPDRVGRVCSVSSSSASSAIPPPLRASPGKGNASPLLPHRARTRHERRSPKEVSLNEHDLFEAPPADAANDPGPRLRDSGHDPSGHRARLRKRLLEGGPDALADHELLEYLLATAIPRRDTKPLARALLRRFGSLPAVFTADPRTLARHPGMGETSAAALHVVAVAARRFARVRASEQPLLASWQALIDYLAIDMAHLTVERVRVLYLDIKNRLVADEAVSEGTTDEAAVHPREVIRRALDLGASALILVHNHPSGSPQPSRADIQVTHRIAEAGQHLGITVHDHVIIGREGHVSLKAKGLL
ncbi:MAG: DNA repair protein RadC [Sphingomonadales bacterium]|nr:DNA repair protein RadC [Sphingomonadales bacterium]